MRLLIGMLIAALAAQAAGPYEEQWHAVARRLIQTPPETYPYDWGEGVQMIGLMKIWERSQQRAYADYVERWMAIQLKRDIKDLLAIGEPVKQPGFCGHWSPATASLYLHKVTGKPEHRKLAVDTAEFIAARAGRGPDGGLAHWKGNTQYWVDTLYMACPLLSGLGSQEESARQIIVFEKHLCDPEADLFYHMWDWKTGKRTPELWARGNGWVLMSIADTYEAIDRRHSKYYNRLKRLAERMAKGLEKTQDADGMWHTVLNDPKSYPEASATAMFVYGLLKLERLGAFPFKVRPLAMKAWKALNEKYVKDGVVTGVSAGTVTSQSGDFYRKVPVGSQTWGTGAYLMAGSEAAR